MNNRGGSGTTTLEAAIAFETRAANAQSNITITNNSFDGNGKAVNASPSFTTADTSVVTVSSAGVVRARGTGFARVVAAAGGKADTSMITVVQLVAAVALVTQRADPFDQRVGKGGDAGRQASVLAELRLDQFGQRADRGLGMVA